MTRAEENRAALLVAGACALAYLPFTLLGYGTDIDVANVLRAGRAWLDGDYELSRGPGAAIHELATAVLDEVGGSVLVNLASVAMAALALWALHRLVADSGCRHPTLVTLVVAANPWFVIAATSLGDFVWALGLLLSGAWAARRDRRLAAGLLFGLAIGCRASTLLLVAGWLAAERVGDRVGRPPVASTVRTASVALAVGLLCFVPPWLDAGRTLDFLDNELEFVGFGVHLGRWAVKNAAVIGVLAAVVLLAGLRHLVGALRRWGSSLLVRFGVLMVLATELLFFRLPFKPLHLLPAVVGTALVISAAPRLSSRWLAALVVAQLVGGLVGTTFAAPDEADDARAGNVELHLRAGPLLTDVRCRLDDRDLGPWPEMDTVEATSRAAANADCQNAAWRAGTG